MRESTCLLCFSVNTNVYDIKNTHYQNVYEAISDLQIQADSHPLCYICYKRLLQCEQLVRQIQEIKGRSDQTERTPLVELSVASDYLSTPSRAIKREHEIKVEYNEDEEPIKTKRKINKSVDKAKPNTAYTAKPKTRPKIYKCNSCDKTFSQSSHLYRHHNTHTGLKTYQCDICGKSFIQRDTLVRHRQTHIAPITPTTYYCDICHTPFKRKDYLKGHMAIHTGERFQCNTCGRLFNLQRLLKIHERIHTGNKPFCCAECGKRFNESGHLKKHMLTHVDKDFKCDICSRSFKRLIGLKTHRRSHDRRKKANNQQKNGISVMSVMGEN